MTSDWLEHPMILNLICSLSNHLTFEYKKSHLKISYIMKYRRMTPNPSLAPSFRFSSLSTTRWTIWSGRSGAETSRKWGQNHHWMRWWSNTIVAHWAPAWTRSGEGGGGISKFPCNFGCQIWKNTTPTKGSGFREFDKKKVLSNLFWSVITSA